MKIIDHGKWIPYSPDMNEWPDVPKNALFCKRESDGVDWYKYSHPSEDDRKRNRLFSGKFQDDSVKIAFTFHDYEKRWIIGPSTTDVSAIFPANHYVREIIDFGSVDEDKIIAAFRNRVIDPNTNEMSSREEVVKLMKERGEILPSIEDRMFKIEEAVAKILERIK